MIVRDREDLIGPAIDSVLSQRDPHFELVVVDDGSRDRSVEVASTFSSQDPRVRVVRNTAVPGIPGARNYGVSSARGEFLAICDSDDVSRPGRFARQRAILTGDQGLAGVGGQISCFSQLPGDVGVPGWRWGLAGGRPPYPFPTAMLRLDAIRSVGGFDESFTVAEDLDLAYRLVTAGWRLAMIDEVLVDYRVHGQGITTRSPDLALLTLRAQLRGWRGLHGRMTPQGYATIGQSLWRAAAERYRNRFRTATAG